MRIRCTRCGEESEPIAASPYPGELGELLQRSVCSPCLEEWKKFSVMVINDFKLRPFLPQDRAVLEQHLREFLNLPL